MNLRLSGENYQNVNSFFLGGGGGGGGGKSGHLGKKKWGSFWIF